MVDFSLGVWYYNTPPLKNGVTNQNKDLKKCKKLLTNKSDCDKI